MTELLCLSVRPPWCDAIVDGHKPIENRSQGFRNHYTGLLIICRTKAWSFRGQRDPRIRAAYPDQIPRPAPKRWEPAAIGAVHVDEIHVEQDGCCAPWGERDYVDADGRVRKGLKHIVMRDPVRFETPVECTGRLGLWAPAREVAEQIVHQLELAGVAA